MVRFTLQWGDASFNVNLGAAIFVRIERGRGRVQPRSEWERTMKLDGTQVIAADRMAVWNAINDPEVLRKCIPGCEEMEKTSPTEFQAVVKQKVGPVSAKFNGTVVLSDIDEGNSLRLDGEGKGGVAGMAKGGALVTLTDVEGGTQLSYDASASVAGKLAQLGSRLIDGVAQRMAGQFFENFRAEVESGDGAGGAGALSTASASGGGASSSASSSSSNGAGAAMAAATAGASAATVLDASSIETMAGQADDAIDRGTAAFGESASDAMASAEAGMDWSTTIDPAIGAGHGELNMDDPDLGDLDISSVEGGPREGAVPGLADESMAADARAMADDAADQASRVASSAEETYSDASVVAASEAAEIRVAVNESVEAARDSAVSSADASRVGMEGGALPDSATTADGMADRTPPMEAIDTPDQPAEARSGIGAAATAGGIAAAASGFAAQAGSRFNEAHDNVRERVIAAGGEVDEDKSWGDTKDHLRRAGSEARDTVEDVYDAAKARVKGDADRAKSEWNEAKTNASDTMRELKGGAEDAYTTGKGYAAEQARTPSVGPMGQPWYLWIIGIVVLLVLIWMF